MAAKLTRLTHKIVIQLHVVAESCAICSYGSRRPVRKLLVTLSYYRYITLTHHMEGGGFIALKFNVVYVDMQEAD
jgi:hypothetical protein